MSVRARGEVRAAAGRARNISGESREPLSREWAAGGAPGYEGDSFDTFMRDTVSSRKWAPLGFPLNAEPSSSATARSADSRHDSPCLRRAGLGA